MGKFSDLLQGLFRNNKIIFNPRSKNGDIDSKHAKIATNMHNIEYHFHDLDSKQLEEIYETVINKSSSSGFKEKILPIEKLISDSKPFLAIKEYEKLIQSDEFEGYSNDEKFLIYNGLLNCFINIDAGEEIIDKWSLKINSLGTDIKEIHRYYFLLSVWKYNKKEVDKAIILNKKAIEAKPDYINALAGRILLKATKNDISYDEAKEQLNEMLEIDGLEIKDKATIYANLGEVAFKNYDFCYAKENFHESQKYGKSLANEINIAICEYFESIKNIKDDGIVTLDNIDYEELKKAEEKFEAIYKEGTSDTMQTISRLTFAFLFNIFSVSNKQKRTLEILNESRKFIDLTQPEILKNIVEAEVINGIYNDETFSLLDDYDKIKYKSFYYEFVKEYKAEIELLVPVLENEYQDDKILQLSLLNALKEDDQLQRYLYYYKKFTKDTTDEVLWMNYIKFLDDRGEKEKVILEIQKINKVAKNSFVLYDLLEICLKNKLRVELDEFFDKVDNGEYKIIGFQMPFVLFNKLMHLLEIEQYKEFFEEYEKNNLEILPLIYKAILKINYYTFKGDFDKTAKAFFELFKINQDHNVLIKAVELKLMSNALYDAELYLQYVIPMLLEKPELYYIYYAIILEEKGDLKEAFSKLNEIKEFVKDNLDSPYHQFYFAFCMNNGRVEDGIKYMVAFNEKQPDSNWFKVIKHTEDESGEALIQKLESVTGGKRDLTQLNWSFNQGIIGISIYNKLVGTRIEEILQYNHYPFTNIHIASGDINKVIEESEKIVDKILIDANSLNILSEIGSLKLLDSFKEVLLPFSAISIIKQRQSDIWKSASKDILKHLNISPNIKEVPVDISLKITGDPEKLISEDILDCIALSEHFGIPFLNTEISVVRMFNDNYCIDLNAFFLNLKNKMPKFRKNVAFSIAKLREYKTEFISFDGDDIYLNYQENGIDGIKPFLRMGTNADYKTFIPSYIFVLVKLRNEVSTEEFYKILRMLINFMDEYVGKTRYYMSSIIMKYPHVKDDFEELIKNCSVKNIMNIYNTHKISVLNAQSYMDIIKSSDFTKIIGITAAYMIFIIRILVDFGDNVERRNEYISFIKENISINRSEDIDYIVTLLNENINPPAVLGRIG